MSQSTIIVGAILLLFFLFITARGELGKYISMVL